MSENNAATSGSSLPPNYRSAVIEYRDEDTDIVFRWHGGAYIDVGYDQLDDENWAFDVINVWDDEKDVSVYEVKAADAVARPFRYILELFEQDCQAYLNRISEDEE